MNQSRLHPLFEKITIGMFSYGFMRSIRAEYPAPYDAFGSRFTVSLLNGVFYTFPPITLVKLIDTIDRCDVYLTKKDPEKYDKFNSIYSECFGLGKNKNVIL